MSILDKFLRLFRLKSAVKRFESQVEAIPSEIKPVEQPLPFQKEPESPLITVETAPTTTEIERESYHLGLAAGYTGKAIKDIESSLSRIESQMATKDWVSIKLQEQTQFIEKRFEEVEKNLGISKGIQPTIAMTKPVIFQPLSSRMQNVLIAIKEAGEISYDDLALKLDIGVSDLRSLLSIMTKRTNVIERFKIGRRGWVKYKGEAIE